MAVCEQRSAKNRGLMPSIVELSTAPRSNLKKRNINMKNLLSLQQDFQNFLLNKSLDIEKHIVASEQCNANIRLAIYANAYVARLTEVLIKDYPALYMLLGDEKFKKIASEYIKHHPSCFRSVRWFGMYLSKFLSEDNNYKTHTMPIELAQFEWHLSEAFDAADSQVLTLNELLNVAAEEWPIMKIKLMPSLRMGYLQWNTLSFWQATQQNQINIEPAVLEQQSHYLIWRNQFHVKFREASREEMVVVEDIMNGNNFAAICERLCEFHAPEHVALIAVNLLKKWISDGIIADTYTNRGIYM